MRVDFGKVAVLLGGNSAERDVSLASGNAVFAALKKQGIHAELIDPKYYDVTQLKKDNFDLAFIALHGRGGEDGTIQGLLTYLGIRYTGSGVLSSAIGMDKSKTKQIWQSCGLPVAKSHVVHKNMFTAADAPQLLADLSGVVIVKPVHEGSSIGLAKATNPEELIYALDCAFEFDNEVLVEVWITGDEYTVPILKNLALPAIKLKYADELYDYKAKYISTDTQYSCPCGLDDDELSILNKLAEKAFSALGCISLGRVDFMRDEHDNWYLLEVNTVPGLTDMSLVPKAAKQADISFEDLIFKILLQAIDLNS